VVEADEREAGLRALLNYGHTIGHAIEAATGYGRYRHGEAVILGMVAAGHIGERLGRWPASEQRRQDALLERLGVPSGVDGVPAERILERARADKKRAAGRFRFVLLRRVGEAEMVEVEEAQVRAAIEHLQRRY
jgi:3-dehydroquinate synthase